MVTRGQLEAAGLTASAIQRRMRTGWLRPLHRGVYRIGPIASPLFREMAAVLAVGDESVLSHVSAALVQIPEPPARLAAVRSGAVDVIAIGANRRQRPGVRVHRFANLPPDERGIHEGVPITIPARTLLDAAGMVGSREIEALVARAEREGLVSREDLIRLMQRHPRRPGTAALRALLMPGTELAMTRSNAEEVFLTLIREARLDGFETNVPFGRYELDFLWRKERIAVEIDGRRYHSSRPRSEGDRRKDAWLLGQGITVLRLSWDQITRDRTATAVAIGRALALAGERG